MPDFYALYVGKASFKKKQYQISKIVKIILVITQHFAFDNEIIINFFTILFNTWVIWAFLILTHENLLISSKFELFLLNQSFTLGKRMGGTLYFLGLLIIKSQSTTSSSLTLFPSLWYGKSHSNNIRSSNQSLHDVYWMLHLFDSWHYQISRWPLFTMYITLLALIAVTYVNTRFYEMPTDYLGVIQLVGCM